MIMQFSPSLWFLPDKFHPEILTGRGRQTRVGRGKQYSLLVYTSVSRKRYEIRPQLLVITNRKMHMGFRLAPRLMTLDDLELLSVRLLSEMCVVEL